MKRKGISPLIAAVLLIAFTMAVASIFAQWAPQLIQSAQGDTTNQSDELQRCSSVNIQVVRDVSDATSVTVQQTSGDTGVGELSATFFYNQGPVQASDNGPHSIDDSRGTAQISITDAEANSLEGISSGTSQLGINDLESVEVSPTGCEGTAPASWSP